MEGLKIFQDLIKWVLRLLGRHENREKEKKQRVIDYIDKCLEHLERMLFPERHSDDELEYSRVFLQKAFHNIFDILDGVASAKECDIIRKSLMAGRIYFHAAKYGAVADAQIKADYEDRFYAYVNHIYDQEVFRQNSNEPVLKALVKDGEVLSVKDRDYELQRIKTVCREDIERIESLRETLKSRKVLM